ncbi:MAG: tyrosine recombinase XerC [Candidatus Marinimicrobia bacterium]|jgi:tyrosine recombinase XerC|nr:tyrosine recombinase XerC [Candidatus Neomarinimicrobiota bacterium]MBT3495656.1 tyrosine recombinase XerC [Candidatus Neomarinimicrobiota bacterium]MBT3692605.1 tyrosine recombinase XerC [Candidatus Neomarinimicrobiota bacterium]MBT3731891.1 tyrosine recombinase XerC [Candidatus Neomarinimicrobiota bacterium]MBT4144779.1 tyrosine recombinase XerC [Candidatus Neomarinimicrobiota bacterium]
MADRFNDRLKDFLKYIKEERQYSQHTVSAYQKDLTEFISFLHDYHGSSLSHFSQVDKQSIRHYLGKKFEEGVSARTVARRLASIKSFFKYLFLTEEIKQNPAIHVKTPKVGKKLPMFINNDTMNTLLNIPDSHSEKGLRDLAIMELFYATGIRLSELIGLNVADIDFSQKMIRVCGKGNKERLVPFGESASNALQAYAQKVDILFSGIHHHLPLFCSIKGKRIAVRTVQSRIKGYLSQVTAGERLGPHLLRHSFATAMMDQGADIRAVQEFLGHTSLSSTQIYTHLKPEKIKETFEKTHPHGG